MERIRSPIIVVVGHVDHGKSTLLDKIRKTTVQKSEAGGITQSIGATEIPTEKIKEISGPLLEKLNIKLDIPGILAIDTPGHEAFTNLRKRGGSIADLAILVIDINEGVMPQTRESIEILKQFKVPFVIAANKIDLIPGWRPKETLSYLESISTQNQSVKEYIQNRVYDFMAKFGEYGINCDLFNKINDFTQTVAIVPCSGITGEGISELLMMVSGLAQRFLKNKLKVGSGNAKGSILEVKESVGLGTTIDVIIYDGVLKKNHFIVFGGLDGANITKIRALLKPTPLQEIRYKKCNFEQVDEVVAASGVRISAPNLDKAIAGMPIESAETMDEAKRIKQNMELDINEVFVKNGDKGIVLKADSIGSLEAITGFLRKNGVEISESGIGTINKMDAINANNMKLKKAEYGAILGFNVKISEDAERMCKENGIKVITSNIIYKLLDDYKEWKEMLLEEAKKSELKEITMPCKIQVMGEFIFRKSNPAVVGVNVLQGVLRPNIQLMKENGEVIGTVKQIQNNGITIQSAKAGDKVACSIQGAVYERDFRDNEILYSAIPEKDFLKIKKRLKSFMSKSEIELVKEIAAIQRKNNPLWGLG